MISVVIPLYNKKSTIQRTVESVLAQTFGNFELLIIDDGSTDGSRAIVEAIDDQRIRMISKPNGGVSSARNRGIKESKCDHIAFLDGDDWWHPDFLKTLYAAAIQNPEFGVWCCQYVQVDESGRQSKLDRFPSCEAGAFDQADYPYTPWSSSILVKRSVFDQVGGFNEALTHGEDGEMWTRIGKKFEFFYIADVLAYYDVSAGADARTIHVFPQYHQHAASVINDLVVGCSPKKQHKLRLKQRIFLENFYARRPFDRHVGEDAKRYLADHSELVPVSSILRKGRLQVLVTRAIPLFMKRKLLGFKRKLQNGLRALSGKS